MRSTLRFLHFPGNCGAGRQPYGRFSIGPVERNSTAGTAFDFALVAPLFDPDPPEPNLVSAPLSGKGEDEMRQDGHMARARQFPVGNSARVTTSVSADPTRGSSFNPSCCCTALNKEIPPLSAACC